MALENTLPYYYTATITTIKSCTVQAPGLASKTQTGVQVYGIGEPSNLLLYSNNYYCKNFYSLGSQHCFCIANTNLTDFCKNFVIFGKCPTPPPPPAAPSSPLPRPAPLLVGSNKKVLNDEAEKVAGKSIKVDTKLLLDQSGNRSYRTFAPESNAVSQGVCHCCQ